MVVKTEMISSGILLYWILAWFIALFFSLSIQKVQYLSFYYKLQLQRAWSDFALFWNSAADEWTGNILNEASECWIETLLMKKMRDYLF